MIEFQMGLIGLGVVVVVGVFGYNKWQEYCYCKLVEVVFKLQYEDVLFGDGLKWVLVECSELGMGDEEIVMVSEWIELMFVDSQLDMVEDEFEEVLEIELFFIYVFFVFELFLVLVFVVVESFFEEVLCDFLVGGLLVELFDFWLEFIVVMEFIELVLVNYIFYVQCDVLYCLNKLVYWFGFNE